MNSTLMTGMFIVTGALIFYSIAVWTEQRKKIYKTSRLKTAQSSAARMKGGARSAMETIY
jgi:hypothetical protein